MFYKHSFSAFLCWRALISFRLHAARGNTKIVFICHELKRLPFSSLSKDGSRHSNHLQSKWFSLFKKFALIIVLVFANKKDERRNAKQRSKLEDALSIQAVQIQVRGRMQWDSVARMSRLVGKSVWSIYSCFIWRRILNASDGPYNCAGRMHWDSSLSRILGQSGWRVLNEFAIEQLWVTECDDTIHHEVLFRSSRFFNRENGGSKSLSGYFLSWRKKGASAHVIFHDRKKNKSWSFFPEFS